MRKFQHIPFTKHALIDHRCRHIISHSFWVHFLFCTQYTSNACEIAWKNYVYLL